MEEVVFMLQVKRSERGFEEPSSLVSPDALLQRGREEREGERGKIEREGEMRGRDERQRQEKKRDKS